MTDHPPEIDLELPGRPDLDVARRMGEAQAAALAGGRDPLSMVVLPAETLAAAAEREHRNTALLYAPDAPTDVRTLADALDALDALVNLAQLDQAEGIPPSNERWVRRLTRARSWLTFDPEPDYPDLPAHEPPAEDAPEYANTRAGGLRYAATWIEAGGPGLVSWLREQADLADAAEARPAPRPRVNVYQVMGRPAPTTEGAPMTAPPTKETPVAETTEPEPTAAAAEYRANALKCLRDAEQTSGYGERAIYHLQEALVYATLAVSATETAAAVAPPDRTWVGGTGPLPEEG